MRDVVSDCYTAVPIGLLESAKYNVQQRWALNGWIEEVGDGKLGALGIGSICGQSRVRRQSRIISEQARSGKKSTQSHEAKETGS